jgi:hypothetical protein
MGQDTPSPQINASKLRIGGAMAGAIFTIGSMLMFLAGIPLLRFFYFPPPFYSVAELPCVAASPGMELPASRGFCPLPRRRTQVPWQETTR